MSCDGRIAVVHNGIIENFAELRASLEERGHVFKSETDTEVFAHLIEEAYQGAPNSRRPREDRGRFHGGSSRGLHARGGCVRAGGGVRR